MRKYVWLLVLPLLLVLTSAIWAAAETRQGTAPTTQFVTLAPTTQPPTQPPQSTTQPTIAAPSRSFTVAVTGDVLLSLSPATVMDSKDGWNKLVSPDLQKVLREADLSVINLETSVSTRGTPMPDKQYTFRTEPKRLEYLKHLGVDVVSLANNHTLDYGQSAFLDTLDHLDKAGIARVGGGRNLAAAQNFKVYEINGVKVGVMAATRVVPDVSWYATANRPGLFCTYDPVPVYQQIEKAKAECDFLILYVHWGVEGTTTLQKYQTQMARGYIDAGADAVVGSHPHVLQGMEYYKGKPIAYSLGNFIFTDSKKDTMILQLHCEDGRTTMQVVPAHISNRQTAMITGQDWRQKIFSHLEGISTNVNIDSQGMVTAK